MGHGLGAPVTWCKMFDEKVPEDGRHTLMRLSALLAHPYPRMPYLLMQEPGHAHALVDTARVKAAGQSLHHFCLQL